LIKEFKQHKEKRLSAGEKKTRQPETLKPQPLVRESDGEEACRDNKNKPVGQYA